MSKESAVILVIDDNRMNRLLTAHAVENLGHSVVFAENGRQGLERLRSDHIDLVLLDVMMPEMDGYQVLGEIKKDIRLKAVPVIVVSSVEEADSAIRCIEMGAEDYLSKPVNQVLLKARIDSSLEKKRFRDWQREIIGKLTTDEVAEELEKTGLAIGGRMVRATVMFCDICSFTPLAEKLTPSATIQLLNEYYTLMLDAIMGGHGIVNQLIGDGIMAIFGAPIPQPNHEQLAVSAAVQMVQMMEQYSSDRAKRNEMPVRIGIGIATGEMIAGFAGTQRRVTYTCIGDTVNLASRLETHTRVVGQPILIDETTRQALDPAMPVEDKGTIQLKGKSSAVHVYSVPVGM